MSGVATDGGLRVYTSFHFVTLEPELIVLRAFSLRCQIRTKRTVFGRMTFICKHHSAYNYEGACYFYDSVAGNTRLTDSRPSLSISLPQSMGAA